MSAPTEIKTERLLLRPFKLTDAGDVYAYAKDSEWGRFLPLPSPYEFRHAEMRVAELFLASWDTQPTFAISLDKRVIGDAQVRIALPNMTADLGYGIARAHWGKGLMVEAAAAAIKWAFDEFDIVKISAQTDLENRQSWRVMEKLGMKHEGILRNDAPSAAIPGERSDTVHYGILREEWESQAEG